MSRIPFVIAGTQWPTSFEELDAQPDILETDALRVIAQSDDPLLQNKLKENVELAEAATRALEHIYEEDPLPPPPPPPVTAIDQVTSPAANSDTTGDTASIPHVNGSGPLSSPTPLGDNLPSTSPPSGTVPATNNDEASPNSTAPPPPPPSSTALPTAKTPASSVATTLPLAHSAAAVQAAYRQQTSLLGALPGAAALRAAPGAVYATSAGLANGLTGQILYGGKKRLSSSRPCSTVHSRNSNGCASRLSSRRCESLRLCHTRWSNDAATGTLRCTITSSRSATASRAVCRSAATAAAAATAKPHERDARRLHGCAHSEWWLRHHRSIAGCLSGKSPATSANPASTTTVHLLQCRQCIGDQCRTSSDSDGRWTTAADRLSICWSTDDSSRSHAIHSAPIELRPTAAAAAATVCKSRDTSDQFSEFPR